LRIAYNPFGIFSKFLKVAICFVEPILNEAHYERYCNLCEMATFEILSFEILLLNQIEFLRRKAQ
jgi:hypothetical protein